MNDFTTSDMKECQAICSFNENGQTYFTVISDTFVSGSYSALDVASKIIGELVIRNHHFSDEWIDNIIKRLQKLKSEKEGRQ